MYRALMPPGTFDLVTLLGFTGGALLALSGLPQAFKSIKDGKTGDISRALLWMWVLGELAMLIYTLITAPEALPLIMNFGANFILVGIVTWYYYYPRSSHPNSLRHSCVGGERLCVGFWGRSSCETIHGTDK